MRWRFARPVCAGRHEALSCLRRPIELEPRPLIFLRVRHVRLTAYAAIKASSALWKLISSGTFVCRPAGRARERCIHMHAWLHLYATLVSSSLKFARSSYYVTYVYVHMMTKYVFFFVKFKGKFPCGRLNLIRSRQRARHAGLNLTKAGCLISCMK